MADEAAGKLARPAMVGLTGGIACGKSEAARFLAEAGVPVLDTDEVAHLEMQPGGAAYDDVVAVFGEKAVAPDGTIDRSRLGQIVFGDATALRQLNALVHPPVRERWETWRTMLRGENRSGVVVIPLLFETGATDGWDAVICVAAPEDEVLERLARRGLTEQEARQRLGAQWPVEEKIRRADVVIWNDGTLQELKARTAAAWRQVTGGE